MFEKVFKSSFFYLPLIFGLIFSACVRQTPDSAQNSNANQKSEEASAGTDASGLKNANSSIENKEVSNIETKAETSATPDKAQRQKTIDKYIAGVAKVSDAEEYKEARKILYGDLDADGDEDVAAQFTIEGMGGGNNYAFYLAVFKNENGKFTAVTDEVIGGKLNRNVEFTKIENGKMYFDTKDYGKDDGACCPSIAGKTSFVLEGNKIVEKKLK